MTSSFHFKPGQLSGGWALSWDSQEERKWKSLVSTLGYQRPPCLLSYPLAEPLSEFLWESGQLFSETFNVLQEGLKISCTSLAWWLTPVAPALAAEAGGSPWSQPALQSEFQVSQGPASKNQNLAKQERHYATPSHRPTIPNKSNVPMGLHPRGHPCLTVHCCCFIL